MPKRASDSVSHGDRRDSVARKLSLLVENIPDEHGKPYKYPAVREGLRELGVDLTRVRWHRVRIASADAAPDEELLKSLARFFDIDERYLLEDDPQRDERIEAELRLYRMIRAKAVTMLAFRSKGRDLSPEALRELASTLEKYVDTPPEGQ